MGLVLNNKVDYISRHWLVAHHSVFINMRRKKTSNKLIEIQSAKRYPCDIKSGRMTHEARDSCAQGAESYDTTRRPSVSGLLR